MSELSAKLIAFLQSMEQFPRRQAVWEAQRRAAMNERKNRRRAELDEIVQRIRSVPVALNSCEPLYRIELEQWEQALRTTMSPHSGPGSAPSFPCVEDEN